MPQNKTDYEVVIQDSTYYLKLSDGSMTELCGVNELSSMYIDEIAGWEYEDIKEQEELDNWQERYFQIHGHRPDQAEAVARALNNNK